MSTPAKPEVFFPQSCSHVAHIFSPKGELHTALITGGNKLVILRDGIRVAESDSLFPAPQSSSSSSSRPPQGCDVASPPCDTRTPGDAVRSPLLKAQLARSGTPSVECLRICPFSSSSIRVVVATNTGVLLFELPEAATDGSSNTAPVAEERTPGAQHSSSLQSPLPSWALMHGQSSMALTSTPDNQPWATSAYTWNGQLRCRRLQLPPPGSELKPSAVLHSPLTADASGRADDGSMLHSRTMSLASSPAMSPRAADLNAAAKQTTRVKLRTTRAVVVAIEFITPRALCILFNDEAVVVQLHEGDTPPSSGTAAKNGPVPDRVVWRSMGDYKALAVCPFSRHIALAHHTSSIIVFPRKASRSAPPPPTVSSPLADTSTAIPTPVFSPTQRQLDGFWGLSSVPGAHVASAAVHERIPTADDVYDHVDTSVVLAERGLTASLGVYRINRMEWHRVSTHTLLCVTCTHPRDGRESVVLFTVQGLPGAKRFTNIRRLVDDSAAPLDYSRRIHHSHPETMVQLVPSGTISLAYSSSSGTKKKNNSNNASGTAPTTSSSGAALATHSNGMLHGSFASDVSSIRSPTMGAGATVWASPSPPVSLMHTSLVLPFSRSSAPSSLSNKLEFLHVEGDGTVRTSSYRFGRQQQASFAKQRAYGLACAQLLEPLLQSYGPLDKVEVLPLWKHRPVEVGPHTPHMEMFVTSTRRYRLVCHFGWTGVVAQVMVDLRASVYRVECYIALGQLHVSSLAAFSPPVMHGGTSEKLVAALLEAPPDGAADDAEKGRKPSCLPGVWGVALFSHRQTARGDITRLLTVAPLSDTIQGAATEDSAAAPPAAAPEAEGEDMMPRLEHFMQKKCPDKVRMLPALLKACAGDGERLLTQLTAKYGALDAADAYVQQSSKRPEQLATTTDANKERRYTLSGGCVTSDGVSLHVSTLPSGARQSSFVVVLAPVSLESLAPVQARIAVGGVGVAAAQTASVVRVPSTGGIPGQLSADLCGLMQRVERQLSISTTSRVSCQPQQEGNTIFVCGPTLPSPHATMNCSIPPTNTAKLDIIDIQGQLLVNHDTAVGVLVASEQGGNQLRLFGHNAVQSLYTTANNNNGGDASSDFQLESTIDNVDCFFLGPRGEVLVLQDGQRWARWLRCFPSKATGYKSYHYVLDPDPIVHPDVALMRLTAAEILVAPPSAGDASKHEAACRSMLLYAASCRDYIRLVRTSMELTYVSPLSEPADRESVVPQYHPDSVMQLVGLARWEVLREVFIRVVTAARQQLDDKPKSNDNNSSSKTGAVSPDLLASTICFGAENLNAAEDMCVPARYVLPAEYGDGEPFQSHQSFTAKRSLSAVFGGDDVLSDLILLLPQVTLRGLSSQVQLGLQCIVEALLSASAFSRSVDEAASRYFFFHRLGFLRHRLRLPEVTQVASATDDIEVNSILNFESGRTAGRNVATASYCWAAMSDSQTSIVNELFGATHTAAPPRSITLEEVEVSGAPFWLRDVDSLRSLADRVARRQYQDTQSVPDCAFMYCAARKVGTLAALCKAQNNLRLHAFFSRDFSQEAHRNAASSNAFAAVGKNMPLYGAAFFILAGDVHSAVRIILQRLGNVSLALFILRTSTTAGDAEELRWLQEAVAEEVRACGPLDLWHRMSLNWLTGRVEDKVSALQDVARHPSAHPECLSVLRYASEKVASVALRRDAFISAGQEIICLMRLGRYCTARRIELNGELLFKDVAELLKQLAPTSPTAQSRAGDLKKSRSSTQGILANMTADFSAGTLTFSGFNDDDDDEDMHAAQRRRKAAAAGSGDPYHEESHASAAPDMSPDSSLIHLLQLELEYVTESRGLPEESAGAFVHSSSLIPALPPAIPSIKDIQIFEVLCPLLLAVVKQSPPHELHRRLRALIHVLAPVLQGASWKGSPAKARCVSPINKAIPATPLPHRTHEVFVSVLYLVLAEISQQCRHEALAHALLQAPLDPATLSSGVHFRVAPNAAAATGEATTAHPVVGLLLCVLSFLSNAADRDASTDNVPAASSTAGLNDVSFGLDDEDSLSNLLAGGVHSSIFDSLRAAAEGEERRRLAKTEADVRSLYSMSYEELQTWYFNWFGSYVCVQVLHCLREAAREDVVPLSPNTTRAVSMGILLPGSQTAEADTFSTTHRLAHRLLLCCGTAYSTLRFNSLSQVCFSALHESCLDYDRSLLTNPNGLFLEMDHVLADTGEVLNTVLGAAAAEVAAAGTRPNISAFSPFNEQWGTHDGVGGSFLSHSFVDTPPSTSHKEDDAAALLVQLCTANTELFWQLPSIGDKAATLGSLLVATRSAALHHMPTLPPSTPTSIINVLMLTSDNITSARHLYPTATTGELSEEPADVCLAGRQLLHLIESSWLRRHHTHRSLRDTLLRVVMQPSLSDTPFSTDRMLLQRSNYSLMYVGFDRASCDSVVWSTDGGTQVSHGFREMLAGDNEDALQDQLPERNIATAAFSLGLSLQQQRLGSSFNSTSSSTAHPLSVGSADPLGGAPLTNRPLASSAARARPSPHPHLPFYLTCQPEGRLYLYPFASNNAVASFRYANSYATTSAQYSPNGYQFIVGLQDGSVAGWRFTASAVDEPPLFVVPRLFHGSGIKAVCYCGDRTTLIAAVGIAREPHTPRTPFHRDATCAKRHSPMDASLLLVNAILPQASSSPLAPRAANSFSPVGVGELIIVDTALNAGDIVVRCALPFMPEHAVYLNAMDAVLIASAEGHVAVFQVRSGRLTVVGESRLAPLLHHYHCGRGAADAAAPTRSSSEKTPQHTATVAVDALGVDATVTVVTASPYDNMVAFGLSTGFALLLSVSTIADAVAVCASRQEDGLTETFEYTMESPTGKGRRLRRSASSWECGSCASSKHDVAPASSSPLVLQPPSPTLDTPGAQSVLHRATIVQIAPLLTAHASIMDMVFAPSVLLAGLVDGKMIASTLVPDSLRHAVTAGMGGG